MSVEGSCVPGATLHGTVRSSWDPHAGNWGDWLHLPEGQEVQRRGSHGAPSGIPSLRACTPGFRFLTAAISPGQEKQKQV